MQRDEKTDEDVARPARVAQQLVRELRAELENRERCSQSSRGALQLLKVLRDELANRARLAQHWGDYGPLLLLLADIELERWGKAGTEKTVKVIGGATRDESHDVFVYEGGGTLGVTEYSHYLEHQEDWNVDGERYVRYSQCELALRDSELLDVILRAVEYVVSERSG